MSYSQVIHAVPVGGAAKCSPSVAQTGTDYMVWLCSQQDAQHLLFSFQAFSPSYLLWYILLEQLSFPKVTVFTHICSYQ